ncbi:MAG: hypothetical protein ABS70_07300 [Nitrospira sp. SCN 59-13]|nr:MAG: hypothetical protein ABS70_07300 [Nitrospira sp. SCN 59-13]
MSPTMHPVKQAGRSRVMIVDSAMQFGLKLADCLATRGYHAVLVRDLESTLPQLGEIQPEAILFSHDSGGSHRGTPGMDALRTLNALCPQAPVLALTEPVVPALSGASQSFATHSAESASPPREHPVEEVLLTTLGIPCVRLQ